MANNKIVYNNQVLIDLTGDDVIESDVAQGKIFHKADGTQAIGTASGGGDTLYDAYYQTGFTYENDVMTNVPDYMFTASKIVSIDLPNATNVGDYAFRQCSALTSVDIPNLETVGTYAFYNCAGITTISFSDLTTLGNYSFYGCTEATTLSLPSCTTIGQWALYNCRKLTNIVLPEVTEVQSRGLAGSTFSAEHARTVSLPKCTTLANYAMQYTALTSVSLPVIQSIGSNQWENCSYLESLTLPASFNGVVPGSMCTRCSGLEEVIFEGNVVSVATNAFNNCTSCLVYDFSHCTSIPTLANVNAFNGINENAQIKVPAALEEDWKWAQRWYQLQSHIVGV